MQQDLLESKQQQQHEESSNFVDDDELTEDGEEKSCWDRLLEHNDFRQYQKLSVAIHRNGDATPCAQTDPVMVTADQLIYFFKQALGDLLGGEHHRQRKCSESFFQDKFKMESLLTRVVHYLLLDASVSSSCGFRTNAVNDTDNSSSSSSSSELGFYDYCDGGPHRATPILRDQNHLVRIPVPARDDNGNPHQRLVLPCHFHALNGERITSMKFLDELVRRAPKQQVPAAPTVQRKEHYEGNLVAESSSRKQKQIQKQHPEKTVLIDEMEQTSSTEQQQQQQQSATETCLANDPTCLATFSAKRSVNSNDDDVRMNHRRLQAVNDDGQNDDVDEEEDDANEVDEASEDDFEDGDDDDDEGEEDEEGSEAAEPYVTMPLSVKITNFRTLHLVAVPAGRLFRFPPPAHLGQSIPLPSQIKGANLSQPMSLTALSLSPLVFEIIDFSNDEETTQLLQDIRSAGESFHSQVDEKGMTFDVMSNFESTVAKRIKRYVCTNNRDGHKRKEGHKSKQSNAAVPFLASFVHLTRRLDRSFHTRRSCLVAGFDYYMESHTEGLQIIRYNTTRADQSPRTDFIAPNDLLDMDLDSSRTGGNRFATVVLYLSDHGIKDGGETVFTEAHSRDPEKYEEVSMNLNKMLRPFLKNLYSE